MDRTTASKPHRLIIALILAAAAPAAAHAQTPALDRGSLRIAGTASLAVEDFDVGDDDDSESTTTFQLSPSLQFLVRRGLAVGGTLQLARSSTGDFTNTSYGIGPAITYYFVRDDGFHPFVTGSARVARTRTAGPNDVEIESTQLGFQAGAGILFLLTDAVGIDAGLYYNRVDGETDNVDFDTTATSFGLALGISAFVF